MAIAAVADSDSQGTEEPQRPLDVLPTSETPLGKDMLEASSELLRQGLETKKNLLNPTVFREAASRDLVEAFNSQLSLHKKDIEQFLSENPVETEDVEEMSRQGELRQRLLNYYLETVNIAVAINSFADLADQEVILTKARDNGDYGSRFRLGPLAPVIDQYQIRIPYRQFYSIFQSTDEMPQGSLIRKATGYGESTQLAMSLKPGRVLANYLEALNAKTSEVRYAESLRCLLSFVELQRLSDTLWGFGARGTPASAGYYNLCLGVDGEEMALLSPKEDLVGFDLGAESDTWLRESLRDHLRTPESFLTPDEQAILSEKYVLNPMQPGRRIRFSSFYRDYVLFPDLFSEEEEEKVNSLSQEDFDRFRAALNSAYNAFFRVYDHEVFTYFLVPEVSNRIYEIVNSESYGYYQEFSDQQRLNSYLLRATAMYYEQALGEVVESWPLPLHFFSRGPLDDFKKLVLTDIASTVMAMGRGFAIYTLLDYSRREATGEEVQRDFAELMDLIKIHTPTIAPVLRNNGQWVLLMQETHERIVEQVEELEREKFDSYATKILAAAKQMRAHFDYDQRDLVFHRLAVYSALRTVWGHELSERTHDWIMLALTKEDIVQQDTQFQNTLSFIESQAQEMDVSLEKTSGPVSWVGGFFESRAAAALRQDYNMMLRLGEALALRAEPSQVTETVRDIDFMNATRGGVVDGDGNIISHASILNNILDKHDDIDPRTPRKKDQFWRIYRQFLALENRATFPILDIIPAQGEQKLFRQLVNYESFFDMGPKGKQDLKDAFEFAQEKYLRTHLDKLVATPVSDPEELEAIDDLTLEDIKEVGIEIYHFREEIRQSDVLDGLLNPPDFGVWAQGTELLKPWDNASAGDAVYSKALGKIHRDKKERLIVGAHRGERLEEMWFEAMEAPFAYMISLFVLKNVVPRKLGGGIFRSIFDSNVRLGSGYWKFFWPTLFYEGYVIHQERNPKLDGNEESYRQLYQSGAVSAFHFLELEEGVEALRTDNNIRLKTVYAIGGLMAGMQVFARGWQKMGGLKVRQNRENMMAELAAKNPIAYQQYLDAIKFGTFRKMHSGFHIPSWRDGLINGVLRQTRDYMGYFRQLGLTRKNLEGIWHPEKIQRNMELLVARGGPEAKAAAFAYSRIINHLYRRLSGYEGYPTLMRMRQEAYFGKADQRAFELIKSEYRRLGLGAVR